MFRPRFLEHVKRVLSLFVTLAPLCIHLFLSHFSISKGYIIFACCIAVPNWTMTYANMMFIETAVKDMWRRRALLRSCSALLSLQRMHRRGCPAEVDQLPMLDLTDPQTIESWRKLRQLCFDWGDIFITCASKGFLLSFVWVSGFWLLISL